MRRTIRRVRVALGVLAVIAAALVLGAAPAAASSAPAVPSQDPFYTYSGSLAHVAPGTVLRSRSVAVAESGSATPISATQVLYRTTGQLGQPMATVATIIRPAQGLLPPATTKLVSYQTAYDALGSECDPSYTLQGGNPGYSTAQDEEQVILAYVHAGYTVVVPDYEGEKLDWGAGQESGYGTLDGIRAAENFLGLPAAGTPVGMAGYSGGSIATEFASELAPTYAPALDIAATAEGGIPVDFFHNLTYINGGTDWAGVIPAVLVSLSRAYDITFQQYLSPYGAQVTNQVRYECINSFAGNYPGLTIQKLLRSQYQNYLKLHDLVAIADQLIMSRTGTPRGPLFIGVGNADGTGDGIMVAADDEALAHTYCTRGVAVQFNEYSGDNHDQAAVPFEAGAFTFLTQRLAGLPVSSNCSSIGPGNSLAPEPVPPALTLAVIRGRACARGVRLRLASTVGTLSGVVVTLARGNRQIARQTVATLPMSNRQLTLDRGHIPASGRYTLTVTQGGLTLLQRTVTLPSRSGCLPRPPALPPARGGPAFTG